MTETQVRLVRADIANIQNAINHNIKALQADGWKVSGTILILPSNVFDYYATITVTREIQ